MKWLSALALSILATTSLAQTSGTWGVDADGNWSDSANWVDGTVADGSGATALFNTNFTAARTVTLDADRAIGLIKFLNTNPDLTVTNLTITSSSSILTMDMGSVTPDISVGGSDALTLDVALASTNGLTIGANAATVAPGATSRVYLNKAADISGGVTITKGNLYLGLPNILPTNTIVLLNAAGSGSASRLALNGNDQEIAGLMNAGGGTRQVINDNATLATLTINVPDGTNFAYNSAIGGAGGTLYNNLGLVKKGGGTQNIGANSGYTGETVVVDGILEVNQNPNALGSTDGGTTVNPGATLRLAGNAAATYAEPLTLSGSGYNGMGALVSVGPGPTLSGSITLAGDTVIDTETPLAISSIIGESGGSFGLTKTGADSLTISATPTFTGPMLVSGGTLELPYYTALSGGLKVDDGAALTINPPLGIASLTLGTTGQVTLVFISPYQGSPAITAADFWSGTALTTGATNIVVQVSGTSSSFMPGMLPLIKYSSLGGLGYAAFNPVPQLPQGVYGVLTNDTANSVIGVYITAVGSSLTWYGGSSATWDTTTANWNYGSEVYQQYGDGAGDAVIFDDYSIDPNTLRTNISLAGSFSPMSMLVNNWTLNYSFGGPGKLTGQAVLGKDGTAALTLSTANDFTGGSSLTNGVVRLGNDLALGAGPVGLVGATLSSDSAAARTLTNALTIGANSGFGDGVNSGVLTLSGPVSFDGAACNLVVNNDVVLTGTVGTGGLDQKSGPGTLTFQGATTAMTAGSLQIQDGAVLVSGGTFDRRNADIQVASLVPGGVARFAVNDGGVVSLSGTANHNLWIGYPGAGDPSATNVVDIAGTLARTVSDANGAVEMGANSALAQLNLRAGGLLRVGRFIAQGPNSEVNLDGGTLAGTTSRSDFMQGLGACYIRSGGVTIDTEGLSGQPLDLAIAQALLDGGGNGGLTKTGQGTLTLAGADTYTGGTLVNAGTLVLGPAHAAAGPVSVADGASLGFVSDAAGASVLLGSATIGSATGASLSVAFAGQSGNPSAPAAVVSSLTLNGTVTVNLTQLPGIAVGTMPLVSYTTLAGGGSLATGTLPMGVLGTVTNNTATKTIELVVTRDFPAGMAKVFDDTFEPDGLTAATRNDDLGPAFGLDIQWRPRLTKQAKYYSVVNDPVLGNALQWDSGTSFNQTIAGQFDNDASDDITLGGSSTPVSLGTNVGDKLRFSTDFRTATVTSGPYNLRVCLEMDPDGPIAADPGTVNSWINNCFGYYVSIPSGTAGQVSLWKESGTTGDGPGTGADVTQMSPGMTNVTAGIAMDTDKHTLMMELTRLDSGVQIDAYWDGVLVSTATDETNAPYTSFNSLIMVYGAQTPYLWDNVQMLKIDASALPVAGTESYTLGQDTTLDIAAPGVLGNDTDPSGYPLTACLFNQPAHGTVSLSPDGGFTYTPEANYAGADSFSYQADNGFVRSLATTVSLNVTNNAAVPPLLSASASGSNLILSGAGGTPGATAYVLTSTNVALPLSDWTVTATNVLDGAGAFSFTNAIDPAQPQQFFRIQMP